MKPEDGLQRHRLDVFGVVQGVGFRPHVARLADSLGLAGWVRNDPLGATIEVEGRPHEIAQFETLLVDQAPPLAKFTAIHCIEVPPEEAHDFRIRPSTRSDGGQRNEALVAPDTAPCDACLREFSDPANRRYRHPFITCTDCGPRWTIVTGLPYDRAHTTMAAFEMCAACALEYTDPLDRRYHAQPIGCHDCGPRLRRGTDTDSGVHEHLDVVLASVQDDLARGGVVAVKGLGGFHFAVDACNDDAVARLRTRKGRPDKPFAIMVPDLAAASRLAHISSEEAALITSPARPIVLLQAKPSHLSSAIAPASPLVGIMLPYTPLHHLLFAPVPGRAGPAPEALVMTSGNRAGEPITYLDADVLDDLAPFADSVCTHDRPIAMPCDDSVMRLVNGEEFPIRRARGYAPMALPLPFAVSPMLAVGGDLKNTCCVAAGRRALVSQHLGDMETLAGYQAANHTAVALCELHGIAPDVVVIDRHPGYHTRRLADRYQRPMVPVGHHHAHLASLLVEHAVGPDDRVAGFLFDGSGWGEDDSLWGGEVVVGGYGEIERRAHLRPIRLAGGEAAVRSPWRMALAYLHDAGVDPAQLPCAHQGSDVERKVVQHQLVTGINSPQTTSMGRLFDAVASILDVRQVISHEAQAAIELEYLAGTALKTGPMLAFDYQPDGILCARRLIRDLVAATRNGGDRAGLALSFHHAVADLIIEQTQRLVQDEPHLNTVGLSGGVFQNDLLVRTTVPQLERLVPHALTHRILPANDGGLALGQVAIAGFRERALTTDKTEPVEVS